MNARIKNVRVGLDDRDRLSVGMSFEGQHGTCEWFFLLNDLTDVKRLEKLMAYTGVREVKALNEKIIRRVDHGRIFEGFGHPIEDKFIVAFGEKLQEITEEQLGELMKTR